MKRKQRPRDFKILLTVIVLSAFSCAHINNKQNIPQSDSDQYNHEWVNGRRLYLDNCSACHPAFKKDSIFMKFNHLNIDRISKKVSIESILRDSSHYSIGPEILGEKQIELLVKFIETPQKRGAVD